MASQSFRFITFIAVGSLCTAIAATAGNLLVDDFSAGGTPPDEGRIYESRLDAGWRATTGYGSPSYPSLWDITGGRMENPVNVAPTLPRQYTESESPVWQWWTNPAAGVPNRRMRVEFDYNVGAGDTLTVHFWAVQTGGAAGIRNWISNNQGWLNGNSGQNQATSISGYTPHNLANGSNPPTSSASISGAITGSGTFKWEADLGSLGIPGITTVGDVDTFFIAFAANETGGGTTWVDNLNVGYRPLHELLEEDFTAARTPPDDGRVFDSRLETGWRATSGYGSPSYPSLWDITGGRMENPVNVAPTLPRQYTESESPVWQWWTNPATGTSTADGLRVTFDYNAGAGDSLTVHLWAVQTGGAAGPLNFISNNQGWTNGNSGQNQATSISGYTPYNLANGSNPPTNSASISGHLTGSGTFKWSGYASNFGIPGATTIGDIDSFFIAFAANETGGGTTRLDNLNVTIAPATVLRFK